MPGRVASAIVLASILLLPSLASGQEGGAAAGMTAAEPKEFTTNHSLEIAGKTLEYTAVAGETFLPGEDGSPAASVFTVSYFLEGVEDPSARPLTFLFNGGPGSSATWLHLGAFGPRRLDLGDDPLSMGAPPYRLAPNPWSLLDVTDLVFVDPVGTGYSHALGEAADNDYWGVDEDAASMAAFIRAYLTHHKRWSSPKYLAGESYGTIRAALLVRDLALDTLDGVALNGVILISTALDVRIFLSGLPGNDLAYATSLPTYAATAAYHGVLPEAPTDLGAFLTKVEDFASTEYLTALFQGDSLSEERQAALAAELHRFTGLEEEYLLRSHLRVPVGRFLKELLRDRGETLGVHDTRFRGHDPDEAGEGVDRDPFIPAVAGPFVTAVNAYLVDDLGVDMDRAYEVFSEEAGGTWKRARDQQWVFAGFLLTTEPLAREAEANRDFRIFSASGMHDLTTSYYGIEYTFDHSGVPRDRLTLKTYPGGHMMYLNEASLAQLSADLRAFIRGEP